MVETKFKQTEVGLIPDDWEVVRLGEIGNTIIGLTYKPSDVKEYGTLVLRSSNVQNNKLAFDNNVFVDMELPSRVIVQKNDILICVRNGSKQLIGKCAIIPHFPKRVAFGAFMSVYRSSINEFLFYQFQSAVIQRQIDEIMGATINQITNKDLNSFQIAIPQSSEQQSIAAALTDADAWIDSLEKLIAKKRLIKLGTMQRLLTPGEDWEVRRLMAIADNKRELFNDGDWIESEHIIDDGIRLIQTGNIGIGQFLNKGRRKFINESSFRKLKCKELIPGDILVCRLAEPAGRACIFPITEDPKSITSVDVTIFRPDINKYDRKFIVYCLCTSAWFKDVIEKVGGTTHKRISRGNLGNIFISLPSFNEQTRIANILSEMDAEIDVLEQKLKKARQVKQGMMQELLSGRIRLVKEKALNN